MLAICLLLAFAARSSAKSTREKQGNREREQLLLIQKKKEDLREKEMKTFEKEREEDQKWRAHKSSVSTKERKGKEGGDERKDGAADDRRSGHGNIADGFMHLSSSLHDASTLSVLPVSSFPVDKRGTCRVTSPPNAPTNAFLFTDIFISGTSISFVSIIYPDVPLDFYRMEFRVVESEKHSSKVKHIGKNLRIVDLMINPVEEEQVVVGVISSPKLKAYLELTDSLLLEVVYVEFPNTKLEVSHNNTYHLFRDSRKLMGLIPQNGLSVFAMFKNEPESTIFSWMDYYIKYVGISHFTLYYNGVLSESRNVALLMDRVRREQRMVVIVEWNQPYKRLLNSTVVSEGKYQRVALTTAMHSAFYRLKEAFSWFLFSEIGDYLVKNSSHYNIEKYFSDSIKQNRAVIMFNRTYLGYMFAHRHRANINDTNLATFSKELLIRGKEIVSSALFRIKFAAHCKTVKLLALRHKFLFSGVGYKKIVGEYESIRMVPRERFNMIYGNETGEEKGNKTTFIDIQTDVISRYGPQEKNQTKSNAFSWKTIINATAVNKAIGVDFSKPGQSNIPGSISTTPLRGQLSGDNVKKTVQYSRVDGNIGTSHYSGHNSGNDNRKQNILADIFNYKEIPKSTSNS